MTVALILQTQPDLQGIVNAWLDEKTGRSGSLRTRNAYESTIASYLAELPLHTLTYDDGEQVGRLATLIQGWAAHGRRDVSPATYNHRVSIVSSFYEYARRHGMLTMENPTARVQRRQGESIGYAATLSSEELSIRLAAIDRSNLIGKRDFAILVVGLSTGRRLGELAGLTWGDVAVSGQTVILHFRHCKGGKERRDQLNPRVSAALLDYQQAARLVLADAEKPATDPTPLWLGFSPRKPHAPAGRRAIAGVCERWLFTSKTHTLRHSFALMMKQAGASVFDIQESLGHAHAATTELYLRKRVARPVNPHADAIADMLNL